MTNNEKRAIKFANKFGNNVTQSTKIAADCGMYLLKIKKALPEGTFLAWIKNNMPCQYSQCSKFMRIAKIPNVKKEPSLFNIEGEILLQQYDKQTIKYIRKLQTKQIISVPELREILKGADTTLADVKHLKTLLASVRNKVNRMINAKQLSNTEKKEVASELRKIIKSTK